MSVTDSEVVQVKRGDDVNLDHYLLTAKLDLKLNKYTTAGEAEASTSTYSNTNMWQNNFRSVFQISFRTYSIDQGRWWYGITSSQPQATIHEECMHTNIEMVVEKKNSIKNSSQSWTIAKPDQQRQGTEIIPTRKQIKSVGKDKRMSLITWLNWQKQLQYIGTCIYMTPQRLTDQ